MYQHTNFLIYLKVCFFKLILSFNLSSSAHYQYKACLKPSNCGQGPNISFPFYIQNIQQSYCGFPGFNLSCNENGFPVLRLSENEYVVEHIFYDNRSIRVFNAALSIGSCEIPLIRNATLQQIHFEYVNETRLHLFSNCTRRLSKRYNDITCNERVGDDWSGVMYDGDEMASTADICQRNIVVPVESHRGNGGIFGMGEALEMLRRGVVMIWASLASDCRQCENSGGRCGFNESAYHFRCFCKNRPHARLCIYENEGMNRVIVTAGAATAAILIIGVFLAVFMWKKKTARMKGKGNGGKCVPFRLPKHKTEVDTDIENFLKNNENLAPRRYKYSDLKKITNSFSDSLGKGGFGSVYKGKLQDGRLAAVKLLDESKGNGQDFMNEVASISRTSHVNIVILLGFCLEGSRRALIYEFMPGGSLDKFLPNTTSSNDKERLGWEKLFEITSGIARGLEYLNQGCNTRILHLDIKPHNILLDKDLKPKISDFGLAKLCPDRASIISMLGARGTVGYIAPEVFCRNFGDISHKADVYSFGMLVLEMVGGRQIIDAAVERSSDAYFPDWIYKQLEENADGGVDDICDGDEAKFVKRKLTIIGLWCIQTDPKNRPSISRVVEMLEGNLESLQIPPKPYLFSPTKLHVEREVSDFGSSFSSY